MAFTAKIKIDGALSEETPLDFFSYSILTGADSTGKNASSPRGGTIKFTLVSNEKSDLAKWATMKSNMYKNGSVKFYKAENEKESLKTVNFEKSYVTQFKETLVGTGLIQEVEISAEKIDVDGKAKVENNWDRK